MTELVFNNDPSLNLIVGTNGTGKSSIADCIIYALYGKIDGTNNSDIPNRINKNFYVKIELDCNGHEIIVERGLAPSLFTVTIDGSDYDSRVFTKLFYDHNILRPSCYVCPYKNVNHTSDITIADCWGIDKNMPDLSQQPKKHPAGCALQHAECYECFLIC